MPSKITTIIGTRPDAIKMAPVVDRLKRSTVFESSVCITAQHDVLLKQVLVEFGIVPDIALRDDRPQGDLLDLISWMQSGLLDALRSEPPELVLVQGDTATALAGTLAACSLNIPVGHIEAGLRTGDIHSPFPEELIRIAISQLARFHFATTKTAVRNLRGEGVPPERIFFTGSPVVESLRRAELMTRSLDIKRVDRQFGKELRTRLLDNSRRLILVTGHRRENLASGLRVVCSAVASLAQKYPSWDFVFPVHPNPQVKDQVHSILQSADNVFLLPPLAYSDFVFLLKLADLAISDSGGIQEEAPYLRVPVIVTRAVSDRPESISAGFACLAGSTRGALTHAVESVLNGSTPMLGKVPAERLYGDGSASRRIVDTLERVSRKRAVFDDGATVTKIARKTWSDLESLFTKPTRRGWDS